MYRHYSIKECSNRKGFTNVTIQLPVIELQELSDLACRYGRKRHQILYSAFRKGLPKVISNLEAMPIRVRPADPASGNTPTSVKE